MIIQQAIDVIISLHIPNYSTLMVGKAINMTKKIQLAANTYKLSCYRWICVGVDVGQ